jgi:ATP-binding cassette, subfamily C (CFTR/MRP), member 1
VLLAFRLERPSAASGASVAADTLGTIASIAACSLSLLRHQRSSRSSTVLSLYLSVAILLDIARTRTLWLVSRNAGSSQPAAAMTAVLAISSVALFFESLETKWLTLSSKTKDADQEKVSSFPEQYIGLWSRTVFAWLAATFRLGYTRIISVEDLPHLDRKLESHVTHDRLAQSWATCESPCTLSLQSQFAETCCLSVSSDDRRARYSLLRACFRSFRASCLSAVLPRLCVSGFTFAQPFLINTTLSYLGQTDQNGDYGKSLIGAWGLVYLGLAVTRSMYQYQNFRWITRLRGALIGLVYQHALQGKASDRGDITAVTAMGTDVEHIANGMEQFHETWASLLEVGIASWLLERQLFLACIAPILIVLGECYPHNALPVTAELR